ncbi:MAG: PEP-CTERM sorting domain-containing protein [Tepidisphaeraceae bacterium]
MQSWKLLGGISALALACLAPVASAAVAWSNPSGNNGVVTYSNGQSDNGYFGDPTVNGASFIFTPSNFYASASNGSAQTTSDRLSFKLAASNGQDISSFSIRMFGDFSILGLGAQVQEAGALFVTSLSGSTLGQTYSTPEHVTYTFNGPGTLSPNGNPINTSNGLFDGTLMLQFPTGVKSVQIVMNDILQAASTAGSTAYIQKKGVSDPTTGGPQIVIGAVVPEPASLSLLLLGGMGFLRRRRSN